MKTTLFPYQQEAVNSYLATYQELDFLNASFPFPIGSGKSITALCVAEKLYGSGTIDAVIIVSPKTVCASWENQIARHTQWPSKPFRWRGEKVNTKKYISALGEALVGHFPVFIANIEAFQTVNKVLFDTVTNFIKRNKVFVILDEGSTIKNSSAKRTKNLTEIMAPAVGRIFLAGVLFSNTILDVYSQYEFLKKRFWREGTPYFFRKKYCVEIQRTIADNKKIDVIASLKDVREMRAKASIAIKRADQTQRMIPYWAQNMMSEADDLERRLNYAKELEKEVFDQIAYCTYWANIEDKLLPPVHADMVVEMSDKEERIYTDFKNDLLTILDTQEVISVTTRAALFQKARQITGGFIDEMHPIDDSIPSKLQAIIDEVSTTQDNAIIVSNYRGIIKKATEELDKIAPTASLFGDTKQEDRDRYVDEFSKGDLRFLVINPLVAARGINDLQNNCRLMYFIDIHVNPEMMDQVRGRIRRTGQTGICVYKYLISTTQSGKDTIDRRCMDIVNDKQDAIESFHSLSRKELKEFF